MMYRKATLFGDEEIAVQILREPEPKRQKALGRKVRGFEGGRWDEWREGIVEEVCWFGFYYSCFGLLLFCLWICRWDG